MASITTRSTAGTGATVKGSPLSNAELDANFIALNTDTTNLSNNKAAKDGANATGTWGINISGNAATASTLTGFTNSSGGTPIALNSATNNGLYYIPHGSLSLFGQDDGAIYAQAYDTSYVHQIFGDYRSGQIAIRGKNNGAWQAWRTVLDSTNYNTYAPTLTGTGASGTWGISISGNSATATSSPFLSALDPYGWNASTLPTGFNNGIQSSFVSAAQGFQNYGSVMTMKTYSGGGGSLQLYVPYGPSYGGLGLQVRFGNYEVSNGNSWTSWKTLLASDNYSSYTNFGGNWLYAGAYYDANNTSYFVDPNGTSCLSTLKVAATLFADGGINVNGGGDNLYGWGQSTSAGGATPYTFYPVAINNHTGLAFSAHSSYGGLRFYNQSHPSPTLGTLALQLIDNYAYAPQSIRSPIFYDSNNTGYYLDPASQSVLGGLTLTGGRPIVFDTGGGSIHIQGNTGGWGMGMYALGSSGTYRGGFGYLGGGDSLTYYWVGTAYNGTGVYLSYGGTSWTALSDIRDKDVQGAVENALVKLMAIRPVYYKYKTDAANDKRRVGVIAQEVEAVLPEAVCELQREIDNPTEETKRLSVAYTDLIPLLIGAIQEQQLQIEELKQHVLQ